MKNVVFAGIASALMFTATAAGATECQYVVEMTKAQAIASCRATAYPVCVVIRTAVGTWVAVPGAAGSNPKSLCLAVNSSLQDQGGYGLLNACYTPSIVPGAHLAGGGSTCLAAKPTTLASPALVQP